MKYIRTKYINLLGYNIQEKHAIFCKYCKRFVPPPITKRTASREYCKDASIYYSQGIHRSDRSTLMSHAGWYIYDQY